MPTYIMGDNPIMEQPILKDILIIFALAVAVLLVCHRIRVPLVVGLIVTGMLAGPYGLRLIRAVNEVQTLAQIGVVLLLFTIGLEFSFKHLLSIGKAALLGGGIQIGVTVLAVFLIAKLYGLQIGQAIFAGFLVSHTSTVIMLKLLQQRGEVDSPHGRIGLGISIFQDLMTIPMVLITPLLAGIQGGEGKSPLMIVAAGLAILGIAWLGGKYVVPKVLYHVARTRNRELFLLTVLLLCLAVALLTYSLGLSLALGAFLAGLIVSESEYSHHALANVVPFRDVFTSFFFISIGMLLNVGFLVDHIVFVTVAAGGLLVLKFVVAGAAAMALGVPLRTGILAGLALAQIGEFSFVLAEEGLEYGLFPGQSYQLFLAVIVMTMVANPFIFVHANRIAHSLLHLPWPRSLRRERMDQQLRQAGGHEAHADHLVIVGFGLNGRNLAHAAKAAGIPYAIIESNPTTVRQETARGEPILYGDATHAAMLLRVGLAEARIMVIAINDPQAIRRITRIARSMNPRVYIIVRTRYAIEVEPLYQLGADEVVAEEFETSVEIFTRVLSRYLVPRDEIDRLTADIRADGYQMFRKPRLETRDLADVRFALRDLEIVSLRVSDSSELAGGTLGEMDLRKRFGTTLLAISRHHRIIANPGAQEQILPEDVLIVLGPAQRIRELSENL